MGLAEVWIVEDCGSTAGAETLVRAHKRKWTNKLRGQVDL